MWALYLSLTVLFYIGLDFSVKKAAGKIDDFWGTVLINFFSVLPALLWVAVAKLRGGQIVVTNWGAVWSILAGLSIGLGTITFLKIYSTSGANLSLVSPVVRTGVIVGSILLGIFVLKEAVTVKQFFGLVLALAGILLLAWK